jgi:hypothetical protein
VTVSAGRSPGWARDTTWTSIAWLAGLHNSAWDCRLVGPAINLLCGVAVSISTVPYRRSFDLREGGSATQAIDTRRLALAFSIARQGYARRSGLATRWSSVHLRRYSGSARRRAPRAPDTQRLDDRAMGVYILHVDLGDGWIGYADKACTSLSEALWSIGTAWRDAAMASLSWPCRFKKRARSAVSLPSTR